MEVPDPETKESRFMSKFSAFTKCSLNCGANNLVQLVLPPTRQRLAALPGAVTGAYGNGNASGGNMNAGHALQNPPQHFTQSGAPIYARAKQSKRGGESETELNLGSESEDMEEEDSLAALASGAVSPILGMMMDKGPNGAKPHSPSHVSTTNSRKRRDSSSISNMHPDTESQPSSESSSGPASASALDLVLDPALFDQPLPEHEAKRGHTEQTNSMFSSTNMLENSSAQHLAKQTRVEHGFDQWTDGNSHTLAQNVPNLPEISDHDYWNQWAIIGDNWARLNHERGASGN